MKLLRCVESGVVIVRSQKDGKIVSHSRRFFNRRISVVWAFGVGGEWVVNSPNGKSTLTPGEQSDYNPIYRSSNTHYKGPPHTNSVSYF